MSDGEFSLPDPPRGQSDEGNWVTHLSGKGNVYFMVQHFGREDTTIYGGRLYTVPGPGTPSDHWQVPDLLIAFDVDSSDSSVRILHDLSAHPFYPIRR